MRHFSPHDFSLWRGGQWRHEWHNGRFGWWWLAAGAWHLYDQPIYPYPDVVSETTYADPDAEDVPVEAASPEEAPPPVAVWYFCDSLHGYYPYVRFCPTGFRPVPAAAP